MQSEYILSIIIPAYNVENFISATLQSLVVQPVDERIEIIVVDDGSTDNTVNVCDGVLFDSELFSIKVVKKENGGASSARNLGLSLSSGEYVWFFDADDLLVPNSLNPLINLLSKEDYDQYIFDAISVDESFSFDDRNRNLYSLPNACLSSSETAPPRMIHYGPWTRILRRETLIESDIRFCERLVYGEDFLWLYQLTHHINSSISKKIKYILTPIYIYRLRNNGLARTAEINRKTAYKRCNDMIQMAREHKCLIQNPDYPSNLEPLYESVQKAVFEACFFDKSHYREIIERLKGESLYPYPMIKGTLRGDGTLKYRICCLLMIFLPFEPYANLLNLILNLK